MKLARRSITPGRVWLTNGTGGVPCIRHRSFICLRAHSLLFHRLVIHGRTATLCCKSSSVHVSSINCVLWPYAERERVTTSRLRKCDGDIMSGMAGHTKREGTCLCLLYRRTFHRVPQMTHSSSIAVPTNNCNSSCMASV